MIAELYSSVIVLSHFLSELLVFSSGLLEIFAVNFSVPGDELPNVDFGGDREKDANNIFRSKILAGIQSVGFEVDPRNFLRHFRRASGDTVVSGANVGHFGVSFHSIVVEVEEQPDFSESWQGRYSRRMLQSSQIVARATRGRR